MHYRRFGKTGEQVSEVSHGTWAIGGSWWGQKDDAAALDALRRAHEVGVNCIDTAWVYGNGHSEELIGRFLREIGTKVFVATKVPPMNFEWPARRSARAHEAFPKQHIIEYTEKSLKNLGLECVDLQQLHVWNDSWLKEGDWQEAVEQLKRQGKIRYFGISINDHQPENAIAAVKSGIVDSVQVIYNIFDQSPEKELFPACQQHGIAVIARVPFDEGSLTGAFTPETRFDVKDWRRLYFRGNRLRKTCERVETLKFLIRDEIETIAQAALKFCLSHPAVTTVIPGMRSRRHVDENCAASDGKLLTPEELQTLKAHAWERNFYPHFPGRLTRLLKRLRLFRL